MENNSNSFAEFIRKIRQEKGFSLGSVSKRARAGGYNISSGYVSQIENGTQLNVTSDKLKALAYGLEIPEKAIFEAALGRPLEESEEFQKSRFARIYQKYSQLSKKNQDYAWAIVESLEGFIDGLLLREQSEPEVEKRMGREKKKTGTR